MQAWKELPVTIFDGMETVWELSRTDKSEMYQHLLQKSGAEGLLFSSVSKIACCYKQPLFNIRDRDLTLNLALVSHLTIPSNIRVQTVHLSRMVFYFLNIITRTDLYTVYIRCLR